MCWCASISFAADETSDALAKVLIAKAGIHVGVCELPHVGDGTLAAALALHGVAVVHGLAPDAQAAATARAPAAAAGVLGAQVVIEVGQPEALPLGDWVADLYLVADATDTSLKALLAAEAGRRRAGHVDWRSSERDPFNAAQRANHHEIFRDPKLSRQRGD